MRTTAVRTTAASILGSCSHGSGEDDREAGDNVEEEDVGQFGGADDMMEDTGSFDAGYDDERVG